jgi:hypothetical protein
LLHAWHATSVCRFSSRITQRSCYSLSTVLSLSTVDPDSIPHQGRELLLGRERLHSTDGSWSPPTFCSTAAHMVARSAAEAKHASKP